MNENYFSKMLKNGTKMVVVLLIVTILVSIFCLLYFNQNKTDSYLLPVDRLLQKQEHYFGDEVTVFGVLVKYKNLVDEPVAYLLPSNDYLLIDPDFNPYQVALQFRNDATSEFEFPNECVGHYVMVRGEFDHFDFGSFPVIRDVGNIIMMDKKLLRDPDFIGCPYTQKQRREFEAVSKAVYRKTP